MEPLESRIVRLTPEQRQEVSDFVDFLIAKNEIRPVPPTPSPALMNAPPVMMSEPASAPPLSPVQVPVPEIHTVPQSAPVIHAEESEPVIHEITVGGDDRITHDYMDYGQFDQQPSPATEAVAKVRKKIIARQAEEKPHHLLDWVD